MEYNRKQTSLEPIDILKFDTVKTGAVFKQYDINTSILELELVANGEPVHLKDEKVYVTVKSSNSLSTQLLSKYSGASVKEKDNYKVLLRAKKSRRRDVNNIIDVYISPLALENSGEMIAEVMIIDLIKEERITSQSFTFEIKPSITPNRPSESAYKIVKDLDGTYITDAEDVQLLVAEVEPNFKLSFVGTRVNEILEKANNFDVEDNTNKIQALQEKDVELESKISNLEKKDSSLDGEIASLKSSDQNIEEEIQGLKTKDESIESEISQLKSKDTAIDGEIDKLKNADETIKSDINSKYEELKQKTDATNNEVMKLKAQDTTLGESIRTNKGLIDVINPKVSTLEQDNQNVKNRVSVLEGDMNLAKSNISSLQSSNTELSQKVEGVEQGNASIDKILKQLQSDVERYKGSIELLESKVPVWKDFKGESFKVENSFYGKSRYLSIKGKTLNNLYKINTIKDNNEKYLLIDTFEKDAPKDRVVYIVNNTNKILLLNVYKIGGGWDSNPIIRENSISKLDLTGKRLTGFLGMYDRGWKNSPADKEELKNTCIVLDREEDYMPQKYFEGIKSLGEQEGNKVSILSHGKNLLKPPLIDITKKQGVCDITLTKDGGFIINGTNSTTGGGRHLFSDIYFYKVKRGVSYTLSCVHMGGTSTDQYSPTLFLTNTNDHSDIPASINTVSPTKKVTFVADKDMLLFCGVNVNINQSYNNYKIKVMLEESSNVTEYEAYNGCKKDISLQPLGFDEGLRGLSSFVYDELDDSKNIAIKRIEKYVVTGDEKFLSEVRESYMYCYFTLNGSKPGSGEEAMCNQFKYVNALWNKDNPDAQEVEGFDFSGENSLTFQLSINKLETHDTEGVKKYFKKLYESDNPVVVYYKLKEPIITSLNEDINFGTLDDVTYVSLENNIKNELSCQCQVSLASVSKA